MTEKVFEALKEVAPQFKWYLNCTMIRANKVNGEGYYCPLTAIYKVKEGLDRDPIYATKIAIGMGVERDIAIDLVHSADSPLGKYRKEMMEAVGL